MLHRDLAARRQDARACAVTGHGELDAGGRRIAARTRDRPTGVDGGDGSGNERTVPRGIAGVCPAVLRQRVNAARNHREGDADHPGPPGLIGCCHARRRVGDKLGLAGRRGDATLLLGKAVASAQTRASDCQAFVEQGVLAGDRSQAGQVDGRRCACRDRAEGERVRDDRARRGRRVGGQTVARAGAHVEGPGNRSVGLDHARCEVGNGQSGGLGGIRTADATARGQQAHRVEHIVFRIGAEAARLGCETLAGGVVVVAAHPILRFRYSRAIPTFAI